MKRKQLPLILMGISMGVLILDSRHTVLYASEGIDLCIRTVIPSLFPFFVLSIYLTGNLNSNNSALSVLVTGFLGGYPVGAQAAAEGCRTGRLTKEQANRLLIFCSQAGPSFLFGIVSAQFPESKYGWLLWAVQILSAVTVAAFASPVSAAGSNPRESRSYPLPEAMKKATAACASVCGWVVLFRVILGYVRLIPLAEPWNILLSGILELTNGCLNLWAVEDLSTRFLLAAVMLNFGGVCVILQTSSVAAGLNLKYYLSGKLMQTLFSVLYSLCFLMSFGALIPIFCGFLLYRRRIPVKRSSIPAGIGV